MEQEATERGRYIVTVRQSRSRAINKGIFPFVGSKEGAFRQAEKVARDNGLQPGQATLLLVRDADTGTQYTRQL